MDLMVSTTGMTGGCPSRTAEATEVTTSTGTRGRAASCTKTMSTSSGSPISARATDSERVSPPATTATSAPNSESIRKERTCSTLCAGAATTTRSTRGLAASAFTAWTSIGVPASSRRALGAPGPSRSPRPAAGTKAATRPWAGGSLIGGIASGREDLVEDGLGLVLVGLLGQGQFAYQNLAGLGQHALLAGGKATLLLPAEQITNHLSDLDDIAGSQFLEIGLVTTPPVGPLLGVGLAQDVEDLVQALSVDDVANSYEIDVVRGDANGEIALGDSEH